MSAPEGLVLHAEYRRDSPWVASPTPRLSWILETQRSGWSQRAAELRIEGQELTRIEGARNSLVRWPFRALAARERVLVEVRLLGDDGRWTDWSEPLIVRNAELGEGEWQARYVGLSEPERLAQPFTLRTRIRIRSAVESAVLYWSALGAATASIDGVPVDDSVLAPGWTSYPDRVLHETTDVTGLLGIGEHVLGLEVVGAWFTETYGFGDEARRVYGDQPYGAAQLHVQYKDGTSEVHGSGPAWEADGEGSVVSSGIYAGDVIDQRRSRRWWGTGASPWRSSVEAESQPVPVARMAEPVRRIEERGVVAVQTSPTGKTILDFGQNLVGRMRVQVQGPAGTEIVIRHAEVLEDGDLGTRPLRRAEATDRFILRGGGPEVLEAVGTFHGFRYAEITGWPGDLDPADVRAVVLHNDMRRTGWFETSHALLQQLHENVVWSMRGNFLSVPSDCPQRDERLGWTGDAQIFAPTAATLFDCNGFLANWLTDLRLEQTRSGGVVPNVVPNVFGFAWPAAGWGDAATVIPTVLHHRYVDEVVLSDSIDSMRAWVAAELSAAGGPGLWESTLQFGDWLDPDAPPDMAGAAKTDPGIVATATLYRSLCLLSAAAGENHDTALQAEIRSTAEIVRSAFVSAYFTGDGRLLSDAPTAYALALQFDLVTDPLDRARLAKRLAHVVKRDGYHISTGFIGTPLVLDALTDAGFTREAARILLQTRAPSWLYPVTMGATTIWERWDSMLPDGSINPGEMTSFNHYALGAVADWLYRRLAGIAPGQPGYSTVRFAPVALDGIDDAQATIHTPAGRVSGGWGRDGDAIVWALTVPAHARAEVHIPGLAVVEVGAGKHEWTTPTEAPPEELTVTLWSPVADIVDSPRSYAAVMGVLDAHDANLAEQVRRRTDWTLRTPLAAALFSVPPPVLDEIAAALDALARSQSRTR